MAICEVRKGVHFLDGEPRLQYCGDVNEHQSGLDLIGVGKLAKAIPPAAWKRLAETACTTFEQSVAPLTQATSGLGRLIKAKFDTLTELEKINAAAAFQKASSKIEQSGKESAVVEPQPKVLLGALEGASRETDDDMRELWANLLAQEFTVGGVHPAIPGILSRLTAQDAQMLAEINGTQTSPLLARILCRTLEPSKSSFKMERMHKETVSEAVLAGIGLIQKDETGWEVTALGNAFIECVQGQTIEKPKAP